MSRVGGRFPGWFGSVAGRTIVRNPIRFVVRIRCLIVISCMTAGTGIRGSDITAGMAVGTGGGVMRPG